MSIQVLIYSNSINQQQKNMGAENSSIFCCCTGKDIVAQEKNNPMENLLNRPLEGKKYQLLCPRGHKIVFFKNLKQSQETQVESPTSKGRTNNMRASEKVFSFVSHTASEWSEQKQGRQIVCRRCSQHIMLEVMGGYFTCKDTCDFSICVNCYDIPNSDIYQAYSQKEDQSDLDSLNNYSVIIGIGQAN